MTRRHGMLVVVALIVGLVVSVGAQTPTSLTVQVSAEPPGFDLTATPASATAGDVVMAMNSRKPCSDVRVRRAITYAVDRLEVLKGTMFGMGKVLGSNVDPLSPYYVDLANAMPYDLDKAKKLLAEGGVSERLRER